jgi:glycoside/pentoside/hexuronide:cation symporter, GPH family
MTNVRLPLRALVPFATGSVGMGIWVTVPGIFLLYFLTDVLAVAPLVAGTALLLANVVDVVLHPWVGRLSDTGRVRDGHRLRLMFVGCLVVFVFVAMFAVPSGVRGTSALVWVVVAYVAGNLLYSFYQVSYLATPADLGIGYHERTRLLSFRSVVIMVGVLVAGVIAPLLTGDEPGVGDYTRMALLLGAATLLAMLAGITGVARLNRAAPGAAIEPGQRGGLLVALRDRHFLALTAPYLVVAITMNLVLAAMPYYAKYVMGHPELTSALVAAFMGPAVLAIPLWALVARRFGKQRSLLAAQAAFVAGSLVLALSTAAAIPVVIGSVAVLGFAFAAMQLLPLSMVPDVIAASGPGGAASAGSYTGLWTTAEATGGALGPYVFSAILAAGGFVASTADEQITQSSSAVAAVRFGFTLVPAGLMTVAVVLQRRYTLDTSAQRVPVDDLSVG